MPSNDFVRIDTFAKKKKKTESKFLINTEISRTVTSVKHRATRIMVIDEDNVHLSEEHSFTNNFVFNEAVSYLSSFIYPFC